MALYLEIELRKRKTKIFFLQGMIYALPIFAFRFCFVRSMIYYIFTKKRKFAVFDGCSIFCIFFKVQLQRCRNNNFSSGISVAGHGKLVVLRSRNRIRGDIHGNAGGRSP